MRTYHYHLMTTAVLVWIAASASTQAQDIHAEIKEWVIERCMEVAAARGVGTMDQESVDLGIGRKHIAELMVASREAGIAEIAVSMSTGLSWEERRDAYPIMLWLCLAQQEGSTHAEPVIWSRQTLFRDSANPIAKLRHYRI